MRRKHSFKKLLKKANNPSIRSYFIFNFFALSLNSLNPNLEENVKFNFNKDGLRVSNGKWVRYLLPEVNRSNANSIADIGELKLWIMGNFPDDSIENLKMLKFRPKIFQGRKSNWNSFTI